MNRNRLNFAGLVLILLAIFGSAYLGIDARRDINRETALNQEQDRALIAANTLRMRENREQAQENRMLAFRADNLARRIQRFLAGDRALPDVPGKDGVIGAPGTPGGIGPVGAPGGEGPPGAVGAVGAQGDQGLAGTTGAQGDTGSQGATGAAGPQGVPGEVGPVGPPGPPGPPGEPGAPGPGPAARGR